MSDPSNDGVRGIERPRSARVLLHVGLAKTGTSSLQELFFAAHPEIRYYGQSNLRCDPDTKVVLRALEFGDETDKDAARKVLVSAAQERPAIVISDEVLTLGEFILPENLWPVPSGHLTTVQRVRSVLGEAHVLIVLRNQGDWLESWHRQGLKQGIYVETDYWAWIHRDLGVSAERLLKLLEYDILYEAYRDAFGAHRVHVRFYEDYRDRLEDLAAECARLIDVDTDCAWQRIRDGQPLNVTGTRFRGHPPFVRRFANKVRVRRILDKLPASLRKWLRDVLLRERIYRRLSEADRAAIQD